MADIHRTAERIGTKYFAAHLTALALDPDDERILVEIDPGLLDDPVALARLLRALRDDAGPFPLHFSFAEPAGYP